MPTLAKDRKRELKNDTDNSISFVHVLSTGSIRFIFPWETKYCNMKFDLNKIIVYLIEIQSMLFCPVIATYHKHTLPAVIQCQHLFIAWMQRAADRKSNLSIFDIIKMYTISSGRIPEIATVDATIVREQKKKWKLHGGITSFYARKKKVHFVWQQRPSNEE